MTLDTGCCLVFQQMYIFFHNLKKNLNPYMNVRLETGRGDSEKSSHTLQQTMQHTATHVNTLQQCVAALQKQGVALVHKDGRRFIMLIFSYICIDIYIYIFTHLHIYIYNYLYTSTWMDSNMYLFIQNCAWKYMQYKGLDLLHKVLIGRTIIYTQVYICIHMHMYTSKYSITDMGWFRLVGSIKL